MPRSKRDKVVSLTQTRKKTKSAKADLIQTVRDAADEFAYLWVFDVEHMRTSLLQEVRSAWKGSRIFMGRNAVMRKALGPTEEEECRLGVSKIATQLEGNIGILFTNEEPDVVTDWFSSFRKSDFARTGNVAPETFELPAGPVMIEEETAPHSIEPQLRKLGLSTSLGDKLNPNQVNLLKIFVKPLATFQIVPKRCVHMVDGSIVFPSSMDTA